MNKLQTAVSFCNVYSLHFASCVAVLNDICLFFQSSPESCTINAKNFTSFLDISACPLIHHLNIFLLQAPQVQTVPVRRQNIGTHRPALLHWLDSTLTAAREQWVVVIGHHPIYAETGKDTKERADMLAKVDPILRRHHVDVYACGHIHNFQHLRVPGSDIDYVVNSAAALSRKVKEVEGTQFCSPETGFSLIAATDSTLNLHFINKEGRAIYSVKRRK